MTSEVIKRALAKAEAIRAAAQKKLDARKLTPEELAQRKAAKAEREMVKRILAEARAEAKALLGIEENPELDAYKASADAKFAVGLNRARRPGAESVGATYWDAAFAIASEPEFSEFEAKGWNKRLVERLLTLDLEKLDEKRAQTVAVNAKKAIQAVAEGYMTTDGALTAAGEGIVKEYKDRVAELEAVVFEEENDDNDDDDPEDETDV